MNIIDVIGAQPQFIRLVPVLKSIKHHNQQNGQPKINEVLVHWGQHYGYEISQVFFDELGLKAPDYHLGLGSGTHVTRPGRCSSG